MSIAMRATQKGATILVISKLELAFMKLMNRVFAPRTERTAPLPTVPTTCERRCTTVERCCRQLNTESTIFRLALRKNECSVKILNGMVSFKPILRFMAFDNWFYAVFDFRYALRAVKLQNRAMQETSSNVSPGLRLSFLPQPERSTTEPKSASLSQHTLSHCQTRG